MTVIHTNASTKDNMADEEGKDRSTMASGMCWIKCKVNIIMGDRNAKVCSKSNC